MKKINYFSVLLFSVFMALYFYFDQPFLEYEEALPDIPEEKKGEAKGNITEFYSNSEIDKLKKIIDESKSEKLDKSIQISAWSLKIRSYDSHEESIKDFNLLMNEGYKVYIRQESKGNKLSFSLFIGPNINKSKLEEIRDQVSNSYKFKGKIVPYRH